MRATCARRRAFTAKAGLHVKPIFTVCSLSRLNAQAVESSYLCRPLLEYFRDCRRRNPRWKLCDPLHITLLRQQKGEPAALAS